MGTQKKSRYFSWKIVCHGVLQRPWRCHGALIAFYRVPTVFMVEILCALTVLSLRVHGAHSGCTALLRRCHCADAVLKTQWHLQELRAVSVQTPTELLFRCRGPYCAAMVTLRRPLCALLGRRANAEWRCLFWVCSKCAPSLGVLCDPTVSNDYATALLRWCLRSYCAHFGVLQFLGHHGITVRTPPWCDRGKYNNNLHIKVTNNFKILTASCSAYLTILA